MLMLTFLVTTAILHELKSSIEKMISVTNSPSY